jgi:hypothetical protein
MTDLYFWAQSLDNQAPDVIFKNGKALSDDESRQKLVSEIYEIPRSNIEVLHTHAAVTIRYNSSKFVIEAIPLEKDTVKRLAPIVIYGELPKNFSQPWIDSVGSDIHNFVSTKLDRNLDKSALEAIKNGLSKILNNKDRRSAIQSFQFNLKVLLLLWEKREAFREQIYNKMKQACKRIIG